MTQAKITKAYAMIALLCLVPSACFASGHSDANKPFYFHSDSTHFNFNRGINTYLGHARSVQGSTNMQANMIVTQRNKQHHLRQIVGYGQNAKHPAKYWTTPKPGEKTVYSRANIIEYYPIQNKVILIGHARVTQGKDVYRGAKIIYNTQTQTVITPKIAHHRVHMVLDQEDK